MTTSFTRVAHVLLTCCLRGAVVLEREVQYGGERCVEQPGPLPGERSRAHALRTRRIWGDWVCDSRRLPEHLFGNEWRVYRMHHAMPHSVVHPFLF